MSDKRSKKFNSFEGIVFSTNPDVQYRNDDNSVDEDTPLPQFQDLRVSLDKKQRAGKAVTIVTGFQGSLNELENLGKKLKQKCGVGGSVKDGAILVQGNFVDKIMSLLSAEGYKVKRSGG
jgi:translation initiation factor 1